MPSSKDVMALQTAAGLENLAVTTYGTALTLPYFNPLPVLTRFARTTMAQHSEHAAAFNAAVARLGGAEQTAPDPKYAPIVARAVPKITDADGLIAVALTLEDVAAATYTKYVAAVSTGELRALFLSVAGVQAQHKAILLVARAMLRSASTGGLLRSGAVSSLPAAATTAGVPDAFYPTTLAAPLAEGAVA